MNMGVKKNESMLMRSYLCVRGQKHTIVRYLSARTGVETDVAVLIWMRTRDTPPATVVALSVKVEMSSVIVPM